MYKFIKMQYRLHAITEAQVWQMADAGRITEAQAQKITRKPRPAQEAKQEAKQEAQEA
jgi:hypothetical protein